jgi:hypothetical protein
MPYFRLPTSDETADQEASNKEQAVLRPAGWSISRGLLVILSIIALLFIALVSRSFQQAHDHIESCGLSSTEALSIGCSFDVMSFAWLPHRCFDQELMNQFLTLRDWRWYLDANGTQVADFDSLRLGSYDNLYVTHEYHMYHCTYMWRKMHRAILQGQPLDGYIGNIHHTAHCERQLLKHEVSLDAKNTLIYTKYVNCPDGRERNAALAGWYRMTDGHQVFERFEQSR